LERKIDISATIVLYKEDRKTLQKTMDSFLNIPLSKRLFVVDNSPTDILKEFCDFPEVEYVFVDENIGFGSAHNLVLNKINKRSKYHLVLNPDVIFDPEGILKLIKELENNNDVAMISPKVLYPDGEQQYTCRKYPTFLELMYRRFGVFKTFTQKQEYRNENLKKPFYPDFFQGCFLLFNTLDFVGINGFDERYFLYMEDVDICKKIDALGKRKMYFPEVEIIHKHRRGSSQKITLLYYHISSAMKYFKKWKN
jgi:GT2 family glycosyltransferase